MGYQVLSGHMRRAPVEGRLPVSIAVELMVQNLDPSTVPLIQVGDVQHDRYGAEAVTLLAVDDPIPDTIEIYFGRQVINLPRPGALRLPVLAMIGLVLAGVAAARKRTTLALTIGLALVTAEITAFTPGAVAPVEIEPGAVVHRRMGPPIAGRGISTCKSRVSAAETLRNRQASLDGFAGGIVLGNYADWAGVASSGNALTPDGLSHGIDSDGPFPVRRDLIDAANVSVVFSCTPLDVPSLTLVSSVDNLYVYRNESVRPRAYWTCGGVMMTKSATAARLIRSRYDRDGGLQTHAYINVRWTPQLAADSRRTLERRYGLADGVFLDGHTWRYAMDDPSAGTVMALIREAAVEDTHGVDRLTGLLTPPPEPIVDETGSDGDEMLTGTVPCPTRGTVDVTTQDQVDGRLVAIVNAPASGYVFLSEPFYPERKAFVDGQPVTAVKANLAFTVVPVPAGTHELELRYVPTSFRLGMAISGLTLLGWAGWMRRAHMHRKALTSSPAASSAGSA